jgi:hypothetical protein
MKKILIQIVEVQLISQQILQFLQILKSEKVNF